MPDRKEIIEVSGRTVAVSHPDKVYFRGPGIPSSTWSGTT
jgi:hypothetical protein